MTSDPRSQCWGASWPPAPRPAHGGGGGGCGDPAPGEDCPVTSPSCRQSPGNSRTAARGSRPRWRRRRRLPPSSSCCGPRAIYTPHLQIRIQFIIQFRARVVRDIIFQWFNIFEWKVKIILLQFYWCLCCRLQAGAGGGGEWKHMFAAGDCWLELCRV